MKAVTLDIDVSPWLDEDGLSIALFVGDEDVAQDLNFTLEELIDRELDAHTVAGALVETEAAKQFIRSLRRAFKYAEKRVKELS
jgi:hypothetical protein